MIRSAAADLSHAHQLKTLCVKTIGIKFRDLLRCSSMCLYVCVYSHQRARRRCLIRIPQSHAKFIPSGSINLLAALDCAPHTKGVGGESCGKKCQPPRLSQSFAYMLLRGGATYYVTEPNDGAICQQIDTGSGFYSYAFIDFFAENFRYQRKSEVKFY